MRKLSFSTLVVNIQPSSKEILATPQELLAIKRRLYKNHGNEASI